MSFPSHSPISKALPSSTPSTPSDVKSLKDYGLIGPFGTFRNAKEFINDIEMYYEISSNLPDNIELLEKMKQADVYLFAENHKNPEDRQMNGQIINQIWNSSSPTAVLTEDGSHGQYGQLTYVNEHISKLANQWDIPSTTMQNFIRNDAKLVEYANQIINLNSMPVKNQEDFVKFFDLNFKLCRSMVNEKSMTHPELQKWVENLEKVVIQAYTKSISQFIPDYKLQDLKNILTKETISIWTTIRSINHHSTNAYIKEVVATKRNEKFAEEIISRIKPSSAQASEKMKSIAISGLAHLCILDDGSSTDSQAISLFYKRLEDQGIKYITFIPLLSEINARTKRMNQSFTQTLEQIFKIIYKTWEKINSSPSQVLLRPKQKIDIKPLDKGLRKEAQEMVQAKFQAFKKQPTYSLNELSSMLEDFQEMLSIESSQILLDLVPKPSIMNLFKSK
jgi:hypothetical protein